MRTTVRGPSSAGRCEPFFFRPRHSSKEKESSRPRRFFFFFFSPPILHLSLPPLLFFRPPFGATRSGCRRPFRVPSPRGRVGLIGRAQSREHIPPPSPAFFPPTRRGAALRRRGRDTGAACPTQQRQSGKTHIADRWAYIRKRSGL